jgi:DNA-binding winged helix-turn-helix (wHTH) protein/Flp pilus assembly protein TadD
MQPIRFGPYALEARSGELRRDGEVVPLAPQPFRLLLALATRPGEVVTREELRREIWGDSTFVDFERGLNFCVLQARTALGDDAKSPAYIETLPRRGYRFVAAVEVERVAVPRKPALRWLGAAAAALLIAIVAIAWQRNASARMAGDQLTPRSTAAREAYLRGRQQKDVAELRKAIRLEPTFALAHVALAQAVHMQAMGELVDARVAGNEIKRAADTALRLAPSLSQSHDIAAMHAFWYAWDWAAAEASYQRAIRLNPNEPGALHDHGWLLITRGRFDEGIAEIRRAQELDPLSPRATVHVAWAYIYTRRYDDAMREARRALALDPQFREATGCLADAEGLSAGRPLAHPPSNARDPYAAAVYAALLGDREAALAQLTKARDTRNISFPLAGVDPKLDELNGDPRFEELLASAGLTRRTR